MHSTPSPRSVPSVALKRVPLLSDWLWPFLVHSQKTVEYFLFDAFLQVVNGNVLGSVQAGSVSSSSTLQIFCKASNLWLMLCLPVYLCSHFPWLVHVQDSRSKGIFKGGCQKVKASDCLCLPLTDPAGNNTEKLVLQATTLKIITVTTSQIVINFRSDISKLWTFLHLGFFIASQSCCNEVSLLLAIRSKFTLHCLEFVCSSVQPFRAWRKDGYGEAVSQLIWTWVARQSSKVAGEARPNPWQVTSLHKKWCTCTIRIPQQLHQQLFSWLSEVNQVRSYMTCASYPVLHNSTLQHPSLNLSLSHPLPSPSVIFCDV